MDRKQCVVCKKSAKYLCGQCKKQQYCSFKCQYQDALFHLEDCLIEGRSYDDTVKKKREDAEQKNRQIELAIEAVLQEDYEEVRQKIEFFNVTDLNRIIGYAKTPEMTKILVDAGANIYTVIKQRPHKIALDELSKHFSIRPFLIEANEETPPHVKKLIDVIDMHPFKESDKPVSEIFRMDELVSKYGWEYNPDWYTVHDMIFKLDWYTVRHMIYNGFFPIFLGNEKSTQNQIFIESLFFRRHNPDTLAYWLWLVSLEITLADITGFKWSNMSALQANAETSPYSFELILFAPHLVYKESRRAKTSMSKFVIPGKSITIYNKPNENEFIPVTRYAEGMSKGLYYKRDNDTNQYCGTFYYFEPESTTFLRVDPKRVLKAIDKVDAAQKLGLPKHIYTSYRVAYLEQDLLISKREWEATWTKPYYNSTYYKGKNIAEDEVFYSAYKQNVYAIQDGLDQDICNAARKHGYDVIILEKMVGSRQIVTEVLDTRPREESFANLRFLK